MRKFWFFTFLICSSFVQSQNYFPLSEVLEKIEKQHQITFNYLQENIDQVFVNQPNINWSLKEKIDFLNQNSKLEFTFFSDKIIIIKPKEFTFYICGYIKDTQNSPIENATIQLSDLKEYAISDNKGYFEIIVKNTQQLVLSINHVSFQNLKVNVKPSNQKLCTTYVVKERVSELQEVIATEYISKGIRKKADGTVEIKPSKFGILPGLVELDVLQTLNQIPGFINSDETISNINVRGGTHDQNLFLWNHIRLYQTGHFFGMFSAINPNLSNTISINKNGTSAFINEGVSSVVDISSHKSFNENSAANLNFNMISSGIFAKVNFKNKSLLTISGRRSNTDFLNSFTYQSYFDRVFQNTEILNLENDQKVLLNTDSDFNFYDFTVQFQSKLGNKHQYYIDFVNFNNSLIFTEEDKNTIPFVVKNNELLQKNIGTSFTWQSQWSSKFSSEWITHFSMHDQSGYNENINNAQILTQNNQIVDLGFKWKNKHLISEKLTFAYGYQFNEIGIRNSDKTNIPVFDRTIKLVQNIHSLASEISYQNLRWNTNLGVRINYAEKFNEFFIEPRWNVRYQIDDQFSIATLGEVKNQFVSQVIDLQQDFFGLEKRRWVLSDQTNIPVLNSYQQSANLDYKVNSWLLSAEIFFKRVNGITSAAQGFQNQLEFQKINGSYATYGFEFLVQKRVKNFLHWINYSYNNTDYQFDGYVPPEFRNNFEIQHAITFASSLDWKKLKFSVGGKWFSGRPTTEILSLSPVFNLPETPEIAFAFPNESNLNDYFQLNISGSYQFDFNAKSNLLVGFSIQNLTNNKNVINQFYRLNQNQIEEVQIIGLKLTPNLFLKYQIF